MKLDKETVVKHQFWFLLGGYLLVWLIAILWLKFTAPDIIKNAEKNYTDAKKGIEEAQRTAVNKTTFLPPWEKATAEFEGHKNKIWEKAWIYQRDMYDWPQEWLSKYNGMTDPKTAISIDDLNRFRQVLYPAEIKNLRENAPRWIEPVELQGGFDEIFKPKTKEEWHEIPTREEVWLAQEDLWVKRELFVVVYDAISWQALMEPKPIDEKKEPNPDPKNIKYRYRFANKSWEITLHIRPNEKGILVIGGDSTIKNIHPSGHPQALTSSKGGGIKFIVAQDKVRQGFVVGGEPVNFGETRPLSMDKDQERKDYEPLNGIAWDKTAEHPILVSQGYDKSNCPIRRINAIELGQQDCRTLIWSLQPNHPLAALDGAAPDANPAPTSSTGGTDDMASKMGGSQAMQMRMMRGGIGGGGQSGSANNPTANNQFERNRYLQSASIDKSANPPSRHLPLAIQVIVEQAHMHDFLLALANSRLRFQITQVEFRHEPNFVPQSDDDKKGDNKDATQTAGLFMGATPGMGGMGMQNRMLQSMRAQQRQTMPGAGGAGSGSANMMQMLRQSQGDMMRMRGGMMGGAGGPRGGAGIGSGSMMMRPMMGGAGGSGIGFSLANAPGGMKGNLMATGMGTADPKQNAQNQQDDNLVELTVYGIATLYRFPDQPKSEQQSGQSGTPTADSAQQGATPANNATPSANTTGQPNGAAQPNANPTGQPNAAGTQPGATPPTGTPAPTNNAAGAKPADAKQAEKPADAKQAEKQPAPPPPPPAADKKR